MLIAEDVGHFVAEVSPKVRGKEPQEPAEETFGPHARLRALEEYFAPRDGQRLLEPRGFGARDIAAKRREVVRPPAGRVGAARRSFSNQPFGEQTFDDAVERACTQPDGAVGQTLDFFHDRVAVRLAVGQRDEDVEHRRRQRQEAVWMAPAHYGATRYVVSRHRVKPGIGYGITRMWIHASRLCTRGWANSGSGSRGTSIRRWRRSTRRNSIGPGSRRRTARICS